MKIKKIALALLCLLTACQSGLQPTPAPVQALPDLAIANVYLGMQGISGDVAGCVPDYAPYEVRVTVLNRGQALATNISVVEVSAGTQLMIGMLNAGESMELYFPAGSAGTYNFVVDPQNALPELDENNNVFQYLPITPTPPTLCSPTVEATPAFTPVAMPQGNPLIVWQSANAPCQTASFWADRMTFGACPPETAPASVAYYSSLPAYYEIYLSRYSIWQKAYAPFAAQTQVGSVTFNGDGYVIATPAEQRMMAEWAIAMFSELPESPTSGRTIPISAQYNEGNICFSMAIYREGRYRFESCSPLNPYAAPDGYLDADGLSYFYRWLDNLQPYQEATTNGVISFSGDGAAAAAPADKISIETMIFNLEYNAHAYASGGGYPPAAFAAQKLLGIQLGIPADQVRITKIDNVEFADTCRGAPNPDELCAQVVTRGLRIMLVVQNLQYEFHTDTAGYDLRQFGGPQLAPQGGG